VLLGVTLAALALVVSGCASDDEPTTAAPESDPSPSASTATGHADDHPTSIPDPRPLRAGEQRLTVAMPEPYEPSAPTGVGTDDYRCFLLDPGLEEPAFLTGTDVRPGTPSVVHHVILFQVPPDQLEAAQQKDAADAGQGWTCFGGTGLGSDPGLDDAPWLGAWAPGGRESVLKPGYGVRLEPGSRIIMQVHYNLLAGPEPDVSAARLRVAPADEDLTPVSTVLLPGPVELPCRPGHTDNPLCERGAALADVKERFGQGPGSTADLLHLLCGTPVEPAQEQSCTRKVPSEMTVLGVAGHMHLLGKSIEITARPGTPQEKTLLDIAVWDFDNQGAKPVEPVHLDAGDEVSVTCRHSQHLRDVLPSFEGQPDRYVLWGEGTTDEMCLGILQVTRP